MASRQIIEADALEWLATDCPPGSIVTSPPDENELGCGLDEWLAFYRRACGLIFRAIGPDCPAVIYATDRKADRRWFSKADLIMREAEAAGVRLLWHKIVLRRGVGKADIHHPGFSHLLAFGGQGVGPGKATPDIIERGAMAYPNAMGMAAAHLAIEFAGRSGVPLIDPFCGRGTVPAMAEALGFDAIGVDIDPAQCAAARQIRLQRA